MLERNEYLILMTLTRKNEGGKGNEEGWGGGNRKYYRINTLLTVAVECSNICMMRWTNFLSMKHGIGV